MTAPVTQQPTNWSVSLFRRLTDPQPTPRRFGWPRLLELLTIFRDRGGEKSDVPLWSPAEYPADTTRAKDAVVLVSCLVLDVDDGTPIHLAKARFAGWKHIGHTSWSHTSEHHKFRLVFPLAEPVPGGEWYDAWRAAEGLWRGVMPAGTTPDTKCKDPSRAFYLPAYRDGCQHAAWSNPGALLTLGRVEPPALPRQNTPPRLTVHAGGGGNDSSAKREQIERYRQPAHRLALGEALGGAVNHEWVRKVLCPGCNRQSLGWSVDHEHPEHPYLKAMCSHKNSCNASYFLDEIAVFYGVEAAA